ncbi:hypothetical protein CAMRE0001_2066 [Campylobacter rectus RM3267]|uniref:Uncharacterized protein n=2 Tax=Campylobacter rectus TaxID=203 RepID=A0A6G5QM19_CAMRE|nr:hypothetical protein CAMRE0001_2066 [Campylobacter rectus RM3267]QCD46755.1 hypothetical protein CRECT_1092 [Campylobacter rectus]
MEKISNINFQNKKEPSRYVCGDIFKYYLKNIFLNFTSLAKSLNLRGPASAFASFKMRAKAAF